MSKETESPSLAEDKPDDRLLENGTIAKDSDQLSFIVEKPAADAQAHPRRARRIHKKSRQGCSNCKKARIKVSNTFHTHVNHAKWSHSVRRTVPYVNFASTEG
jgi:hypothetical protein